MISNMKKKPLAFLIALAFIGSSLSTPAFAAVKAGAKCKIVGQTKVKKGKEFICIAKGKKLVWSKGLKVVVKATSTPIPIPSATPQPEPSATKISFTPWATSFAAEDMVAAALAKTSESLGDVKPSSSYTLTVDPLITA